MSRSKVSIVCGVVVAVLLKATSAVTCEGSWVNFENKCYLFPATGMIYEDCEVYCSAARTDGATMLCIEDEDQNQFIYDNILGANTHIGIKKRGTSSDFTWFYGCPSTYLNWEPGEPSGGGEFLGLMYDFSGTWNDSVDGPNLCACEYTPAAEPVDDDVDDDGAAVDDGSDNNPAGVIKNEDSDKDGTFSGWEIAAFVIAAFAFGAVIQFAVMLWHGRRRQQGSGAGQTSNGPAINTAATRGASASSGGIALTDTASLSTTQGHAQGHALGYAQGHTQGHAQHAPEDAYLSKERSAPAMADPYGAPHSSALGAGGAVVVAEAVAVGV